MAKNITDEQLNELVKEAARAGAEAYQKAQKESAKEKADKMLYRTKVLLERYTDLQRYAEKSVYTLERAESVDSEMVDIELLTRYGIFDDDRTLHNLQRGVLTVKMILTHVDTMLEVYRESCMSSASKTRQRQWRVIEALYLADEKKSIKEIAWDEKEEARTIQRDAKEGREQLTALLFGLDGLLLLRSEMEK